MLFIMKMGIKNVLRNKRRTTLTMTGIGVIVFALVAMQAWIVGILNNWIDNTINMSSGHIRVINKKYLKQEKILPIHYSIEHLNKVIKTIEEDKQVIRLQPRIRFGAQMEYNDLTIDCLGTAVDPKYEITTRRMKEYIIKGSYWENNLAGIGNGIIIGYKTAEELGVKVGDEVSLLVRTADFSPYLLVYKIRAIYKSGFTSEDKGAFYIHINDAADLLNMQNSATEILVMIQDKYASKTVAADLIAQFKKEGIDSKITAVPWQEHQGMGRLINTTYSFSVIMFLVFSIVAGLTILNTMLMTIFERTREIGMMQALGMKRRTTVLTIISEALTMGLVGGIIGGGIGALVSYFFLEKIGLNFEKIMETYSGWYIDPIMRGDFQFNQYLIGIIFGVLLSGLASIYPAVRASKLKPVVALRTI